MDSIATVEDSLDHLEDILKPLLETPFFDVTSKLDLLPNAKLHVLLPYVVNDLIFVYLKTRGINPKDHAVVAELDRVKQYFEKIKKAEDPEKRKLMIDQQAATRFIKHAIKESQIVQEQNVTDFSQGMKAKPAEVSIQGAAPSAAALAKIEARNTVEQDGTSGDDENILDVYDEAQTGTKFAEIQEKGKETENKGSFGGAKRRRGMDPWQGYADSEIAQSKEPLSKKSRITPSLSNNDEDQPVSLIIESTSSTSVNSKKKKLKKKKGNLLSDPVDCSTEVQSPSGQGETEMMESSGDSAIVKSERPAPVGQTKSKKKRKQKQ